MENNADVNSLQDWDGMKKAEDPLAGIGLTYQLTKN